MKKLLPLLPLCLFATVADAQQKADIMVSYNSSAKNWEADTIATTQMTLLANSRESKFFNDISLWTDSLTSTPEGKKQHSEIIMAACMTQTPEGRISIDFRKGPVKKVDTYVFTKLSDGNLRYYNKLGNEPVYYDEPIAEMQWQIGDSTANILGYECVSAKTDYHGRTWTAWFSSEIPIPFGPWKLRGLPGLILKAEADNGAEYVATGIEKTERLMTPMYSPGNYQKSERKKALADHEHFLNNRESIIKAKYGDVQFNYNTAERPKYDAAKYAPEPDYKQK